ncbi:MAG: GMC family oxidoreductase [Proteobacteria bacterium]|nr:GMC family oxidoreductase [Pseudomonadota bacterium]
MIIDSHDLPNGHRIEADLVIVGTGPAGVTIANEFAGSGTRVAVLEAGGLVPTEESMDVYRADNVGWPGSNPAGVRARYLGGTSNLWTGHCRPLERVDMEERPGIPHGGWPITLEELDPFYARAHAVCQLGPYDFDVNSWTQRSGLEPLDLDPALIETKLSQQSNPTRFGAVYRPMLESAPNIEVYLNANVLELDSTGDGAHVNAARIATYQGTELSATADTFVLACGGMENPRLLLNSNNLANGNDMVGRFFAGHFYTASCSLLLGRNEIAPPLYLLPAVPAEKLGIPDPAPVRLRGYFCLPEGLMREEQLVNMNVEIYPIDPWADNGKARQSWDLVREQPSAFLGVEILPRHLRRVLRDLWRLPGHDDPVEDFGHDVARQPNTTGMYALQTYVEQLPNPQSRIRLGRSRDAFGKRRLQVDLQFSGAEAASLRRLYEIMASAFGKANFGRVRVELPRDAVQIRGGGATHHHSSTRMHEDPRLGVVNRDCRCHEVSNLYIAGSSVFTRAGVWNPTLTIVALALRLSDHLREYFDGTLQRAA